LGTAVLESDHYEKSGISCTRGFFHSERAIISFHVETPNEVMNRNSVARMRCSSESGSLHVWR